MSEWLDKEGLAYLWSKVKAAISDATANVKVAITAPDITPGDTGTLNITTHSGTFTPGKGSQSMALARATGDYAHAEGGSTGYLGDETLASGLASHAEGVASQATETASHAEGYESTASGSAAHAEGQASKASGTSAHAEGNATKAHGTYSHAEGCWTEASGKGSHAEGVGPSNMKPNIASGSGAHVEGQGTYAGGEFQHVSGKWNSKDDESAYAEIIGNGTSDSARSNARTLDWSGNEWLAGIVSPSGGYRLGTDTITSLGAGLSIVDGALTVSLTNGDEVSY